MSRVVRGPRAGRDLWRIWAYIAKDNIAAADALIRTIDQKFQALARNPLMGSARPDLAPTARSLVVGKYLILYRPLEDGVEIVRVVHGARRPGSIAL